MEYSNSPISQEALAMLRPLDDEPWQAVHANYTKQLQIKALCFGLVITGIPWLLLFADNPVAMNRVAISLSVVLAIVTLSLVFLWAPKRARNTRYLLRELDVHMQRGLWWRKTTSVGINRVQHLELTQGPLERTLGLSQLILYTAGGAQSDLAIPGLATKTAAQLKIQILKAAGQFSEEDESDVDLR